ncbi:MAG: hypothetical protein ACLQBX_17325 [Candidatus Limnocylindrales bacterium]
MHGRSLAFRPGAGAQLYGIASGLDAIARGPVAAAQRRRRARVVLRPGQRIAATPFKDYFGGISGPLEVLLSAGAASVASR